MSFEKASVFRQFLRASSGQRERGAATSLVRERLHVFKAAFAGDPRPGLVFEHGRLVYANDAAKALLGSSSSTDTFVAKLKLALASNAVVSEFRIETHEGRFIPVFAPVQSREGHSTRICWLVKESPGAVVVASLSTREAAVVRWLVTGLTNQQIGQRLGLSAETVRKHVCHALKKTGAKTRTALAARVLGKANPVETADYTSYPSGWTGLFSRPGTTRPPAD